MNYIHLLEFASSVGLTSVTAYLIFKIVSAIQRQNAMIANEIADFEDVSEILEDEDEDSDTDKMDIESDEDEGEGNGNDGERGVAHKHQHVEVVEIALLPVLLCRLDPRKL